MILPKTGMRSNGGPRVAWDIGRYPSLSIDRANFLISLKL